MDGKDGVGMLLGGAGIPPLCVGGAVTSGVVGDGVVSSLCEAAKAAPETERSKMAAKAARMTVPGSMPP